MQAWRDAYSLATLLLVCTGCRHAAGTAAPAAASSGGQATAHQPCQEPGQHPEQHAAASSWLRELDLAVLMGGPRFRPAINRALQAVQAAGAPQGMRQQQQQGTSARALHESAEQPAAKRRRTEQAAAEASQPQSQGDATCEHQASGAPQACGRTAAQLDQQAAPTLPVSLPPGSFGTQGSRILVRQVPPLEAFLTQHLIPGVPIVLSGEPRAGG